MFNIFMSYFGRGIGKCLQIKVTLKLNEKQNYKKVKIWFEKNPTNQVFNLFMARLSHDIGECLHRIKHVGSLESKWKSNWKYMKIETTWKWAYHSKKKFQNKCLTCLWPDAAMALLNVCLWRLSAMYVV